MYCWIMGFTCPFIQFCLWMSEFSLIRSALSVLVSQQHTISSWHVMHTWSSLQRASHVLQAVLCSGSPLSYLSEVFGLQQCVTYSPGISSLCISVCVCRCTCRALWDSFLSNSWDGFTFLVDQRLFLHHLDLNWIEHVTTCLKASLGFKGV